MRILVLSDTHIPIAASDLPEKIYKEIESADMVFHAGDFIDESVLDRLSALKEVKAVCGNMDSAQLRGRLKTKEVVAVGPFKIGLIHGYGSASEIIERVGKEFGKVDAIVFGHSHGPANIKKDGVLFFNPGSPTDKIFAAKNTYGILEITDKGITGKIMEL